MFMLRRLPNALKWRLARMYRTVKLLPKTLRARWYLFQWSRRQRQLTFDRKLCQQTVFEYRCCLDLPKDPFQLEQFFQENGISCDVGAYAILITKKDVERIAPEIAQDYSSENYALKLFRSQVFLEDGDACYVTRKLNPALGDVVLGDTPSIRETMVVANVLGLTVNIPRVIDTAFLTADKAIYLVQIVEYIPNEEFNSQLAAQLIRDIKTAMKEEGFVLAGHIRGWDHKDFDPEHNYNGNIRSLNGEPYYVDVQRFKWRDQQAAIRRLVKELRPVSHFGRSQPVLGGTFLYQSFDALGEIGRRDTEVREKRIDKVLQEAGFSYDRTRILDIGCNIGLFLIHSLDRGALSCTGIDRKRVTRVARKLVYSLGYSRISFVAADLAQDELELSEIGQPYDLVFFLAISAHIGQPKWLSKLRFRFLLYEGHQRETLADACRYLETSPLKFRELRPIGRFADGDTSARPMVLVLN